VTGAEVRAITLTNAHVVAAKFGSADDVDSAVPGTDARHRAQKEVAS
jgi:hypothetical protein